jgi:hypothetical protein
MFCFNQGAASKRKRKEKRKEKRKGRKERMFEFPSLREA